jgi:hypothetical protein
VAVAAGDDSGGRRAESLSKADMDRWFAVRRSAMDYAIGRQAGGDSDGGRRWMGKRFTHGLGACVGYERGIRLRALEDGSGNGGPDSGQRVVGWSWLELVGWLVEMLKCVVSAMVRVRWTGPAV